MIYDTIENCRKYLGMNLHFATALRFLQETDLVALGVGKCEIEGENVFGYVIDSEGKPDVKLEGHKKYIDLHVTITGKDRIGWKDASACTEEAPFNVEDDYVFFTDTPTTWFEVPEGHFALFFPRDAHAPLGGEGKIKKVVVKILISI
jgi:biofilm protein TabA